MSSSFSSERGSWRPKTQSAPNILDESDGEDTDEIVKNSEHTADGRAGKSVQDLRKASRMRQSMTATRQMMTD